MIYVCIHAYIHIQTYTYYIYHHIPLYACIKHKIHLYTESVDRRMLWVASYWGIIDPHQRF